jgi:hypothetical protein
METEAFPSSHRSLASDTRGNSNPSPLNLGPPHLLAPQPREPPKAGRCPRRQPLLYQAQVFPKRGWQEGGGARWRLILSGGAALRLAAADGVGLSLVLFGHIVAAPERCGGGGHVTLGPAGSI